MTPRGASHPSAFDLDALALGALTPDETARTAAHVAACESCRGRLGVRREADPLFAARVGPRTLAAVQARLAPRPLLARLGRGWLGVPALAAVAVALLVVARRPLTPDVQTKGAALQLVVRHAGQVTPVLPGDRLAPGDQLQLVVEPAGLRQLLIVSVDGAGQANVYFPFGGTHSSPVEASDRVQLPNSLTLDASPGPERIFALFSSREVAVGEVMPALQALAAQGPAALRTQRTLPVAVDRQASIWFEKASP